MKTSTKIKISIITTLVILSNVSFGQNNNETKETKKTETEQNDVVRSKKGPQPTMTVNTESRSYLV
ncbi:MAG: hypothetical protein JNJ40_18155 [Bacteroidia bacterium]|nr:hypothetical protein [Bacteroidia bacterium]